jgi:glycosyltransferase involved in cell wall biosynthesis
MLRSVKPDLVHVRGLGNEGFHAALAAQIAQCPRILVSIHGTVRDLTAPGARSRRLVLTRVLEPLTLRIATHIATVCLYAAERSFVRRHRSKLVGVVPNGVPVNPMNRRLREQVRSALGYRNDEVVGIVVGRLSLEKGHRVLAGALQQNPRTAAGLRLLVVGDGPDREAIRRLYDDVPELRVKYLGVRHDVDDLLQASDIFLFPSLHENLSNALLEAMAAGLPVVASSVGGNVEVLRQGGGVLVPPSDPVALNGALEDVIRSSDRRMSLGRAARMAVERHYSCDHMIDGWDRVYTSILGGHR